MATFADLPSETLCSIVSYLSLWDKEAIVQVSTKDGAFTTAVRDATRRLSLGQNCDYPEGVNLNKTLKFVGRYCPNLQHFSMHVPGTFLCEDDFFDGQWFVTPVVNPPALLKGGALCKAIEGCQGALKSFLLSFEDDYSYGTEVVSIIEDCRKAVGKCESLQAVDCRFLSFQSVDNLASLINSLPRSLVILKLDHLEFSRHSNRQSISGDLLAKAVAGFSHLQQLSLSNDLLQDEDIDFMLGEHSHHLRSLVLSGRPRRRNPVDPNGHLTDVSMEKISRYCTNLQHLDVANNPGITQVGIHSVLQSCPLQEIATNGCCVAPTEWPELVAVSTTLLLVAWAPPIDRLLRRAAPRDTQMDGISAAIAASEGRVVFCETSSFGVIRLKLDPTMNQQYPMIIERQNQSLGRIQERIELQKRANEELSETSFYWGLLDVFSKHGIKERVLLSLPV